jgi:murein DD-endopeptidase MepM/ murein hydrolase activator NlpD
MPSENVRRRKQEKRYSFVFVPSEEGARTRTFSLTRWGIISAVAASAIVFITLIILILIYTPVGRLLPIAHPELEYVYGRQLVDIERQLSSLLNEMTTLRAYNIRLRRALGENVSSADSTFVAQQQGRNNEVGNEHPVDAIPGQGDFERQLRNSLKDTGTSNPGMNVAGLAVQHPVTNISADLPFGTPVHGYFTRSYDSEKKHYGIDIAGKEGSPVFAAAGGRIIFASWTYDDGFEIIMAHDKGYMTIYKHNQALMRNVGDILKRGEILALMGNTGRTSSGPHLHFEIWKDGSMLDPMDYLLTLE